MAFGSGIAVAIHRTATAPAAYSNVAQAYSYLLSLSLSPANCCYRPQTRLTRQVQICHALQQHYAEDLSIVPQHCERQDTRKLRGGHPWFGRITHNTRRPCERYT